MPCVCLNDCRFAPTSVIESVTPTEDDEEEEEAIKNEHVKWRYVPGCHISPLLLCVRTKLLNRRRRRPLQQQQRGSKNRFANFRR